jgi:hypothetical protein
MEKDNSEFFIVFSTPGYVLSHCHIYSAKYSNENIQNSNVTSRMNSDNTIHFEALPPLLWLSSPRSRELPNEVLRFSSTRFFVTEEFGGLCLTASGMNIQAASIKDKKSMNFEPQ